ncbi:MAG: hypothetical protein AAF587_09285 [Bacteroidota bacterium]
MLNPKMQKLLLRSMDRTLSPEEDKQLSAALEHSEELRNERDELLAMRGKLKEQDYRFAPFFVAKVLNKLEPEDRQTIETWFAQMGFAFQRVGLPAMAVVVLLLLTTFFVEQSLSWDVITGTSELTVDDLMTGVISSF